MDWNKSNTILIAAFIILNIFLFSTAYNSASNDEYNVFDDKKFMENVDNQLKNKNINIKCEIPKEIYTLPVLETEYDVIVINDALVQKYLGPDVKAADDVFMYKNQAGETLEITDGKKIIYTLREKVQDTSYDMKDEAVDKAINEFLKNKNIDMAGFEKSEDFIQKDGRIITYVQNYNGFNMDNSYMRFFADKNGIYKLEMQKISSMVEIKGKVRTISSYEALLRILSYEDVNDKDIVAIKMTYYSIENGNWKYIKKINADPTWKVVFSDGTQKHLSSFD